MITIKNNQVYSQANQDGIIQSIFETIGVTNKFCVEFGFNATALTGGSGPNIARLIIEDNWQGLMLDCDNENKDINLHKELLTPENICDVFKRYSVPKEADFISIDVDSIDLWLMKAILHGRYQPRLIAVEYNANFPLGFSYTCKSDIETYAGDMVYGASLTALNDVAQEFNYTLIAVQVPSDLFFLRNDILDNFKIPAMAFDNLTGISCHVATTRERLKCFIEYPSEKPVTDDIIDKFPHIFRAVD